MSRVPGFRRRFTAEALWRMAFRSISTQAQRRSVSGMRASLSGSKRGAPVAWVPCSAKRSTSLAADDSWDSERDAPRAAASEPPSAATPAPARSEAAGDQASARLRAWACLRAANGVSSYREPRRASPADTKFGSRCENPVNPLGRSVIVLPPQTAAPLSSAAASRTRSP